MDNNTAERSERGPVVGRKNYYGSGSLWSGRLAAMMFSLFQTLCLWGLNPRLWLTAYLEACAQAGGRAVEDVDRFLPWNLSPEQRRAWGCEDEVPARTHHSHVAWSGSDEEFQSQPHSQPGTRPGTGYALNGSRRVYRILTESRVATGGYNPGYNSARSVHRQIGFDPTPRQGSGNLPSLLVRHPTLGVQFLCGHSDG